MKKLLIVGASGFGREVEQYIEDINNVEPTWEIVGYLDDNPNALDDVKSEYRVVGTIKDYEPHDGEYLVCALAFPAVKKRVVESLLERGANFVSIIHPTARISRYSEIGRGVVITPYSHITCDARVGNFVSILGSNIAHDASIGDYSTLSGKCSLNGHVQVGQCVYMGCNVCIAPSKKIGDNATIGIGSVVISNVKANTKVFGNPAKKVDF